MKTFNLLSLLTILLLTMLTGCASLTSLTPPLSLNKDNAESIGYPNIEVIAEFQEFKDPEYSVVQHILKINITNLDSILSELVIERCVIVDPNGISHRVLTGEVRVLFNNMIQPNLAIFPGSTISVSFWPQDLLKEERNSFSGKGYGRYSVEYINPPCKVKLALAFKTSNEQILYNFYEINIEAKQKSYNRYNKGRRR